MTAHAKFSCSGASRWLVCTAAPRIEADLPDTTSVYAELGTYGHNLGEAYALRALGKIDETMFNKMVAEIEVPEGANTVNSYSTAEEYAQFILRETEGAVDVCLEQRVDLGRWIEGGFGTADCVAVFDNKVKVIDLKLGQGVRVDAHDNPQLKLYAAGTIDLFAQLYDFEQVEMVIYQPLLDHISRYEMPVAELLTWADGVVAPTVATAIETGGVVVPGSHCKFCKANAICRERAQAAVLEDFTPAELLTDDEAAALLLKADSIIGYFSDLKKYALQKALRGELLPNFKLVNGRSVRKFTDEKEVAQRLSDKGFAVYEQKLLSLTALEKLVSKKEFTELVGDLIAKTEGAPTLVPVTDARPEFSSVASDFSE